MFCARDGYVTWPRLHPRQEGQWLQVVTVSTQELAAWNHARLHIGNRI